MDDRGPVGTTELVIAQELGDRLERARGTASIEDAGYRVLQLWRRKHELGRAQEESLATGDPWGARGVAGAELQEADVELWLLLDCGAPPAAAQAAALAASAAGLFRHLCKDGVESRLLNEWLLRYEAWEVAHGPESDEAMGRQ